MIIVILLWILKIENDNNLTILFLKFFNNAVNVEQSAIELHIKLKIKLKILEFKIRTQIGIFEKHEKCTYIEF